ncbi:hypothetical protein O3M35_006430 [Rhynocoris fuscipes]|uniref:Uncharacterized protein n=1 Tax=Rhynocoris fuscipes TaxID=488301 RepID=A0AAW1DG60_9HEMI
MEEESSNFVREHTLERLINILQSNDRLAKKQAFREIKNTVKAASGDELKELYDKLANILRICFRDRVESCREDAIQITYDFIKRLDLQVTYLTTLIPAIHSRICREEDYEYSEEIRHSHVKFLALLIDRYERFIAPYTKDILEILSKLIADEAPHVKKSSCACLIKCANTSPCEFFSYTKLCIKPLINNLNHQHWRVRVATIEAIEWIMLKGDHKCITDLINPLSRCMLDDSPFVRMAITKLTGHWLLELTDRYSFLPHLVPLILTSLIDESQEIVEEAKVLWVKAGTQYVRENERDYKNRMDYEPETLEHYPPGVKRPVLGCRVLVERQVDKFTKTIGMELSDWVTIVKIKAAQLLSQVILHSEAHITMQIDKIIGPMSKVAMDYDCPEVIKYVRLAAYYLGFFIPAKAYCDLIVEHMKESNHGERKIVASIVSGSKRDDLKEHLPKVATVLSCVSFKSKDHESLLEVIEALFKTCKEDSLDIGNDIFRTLVSVIGLSEVPSIVYKASDLLNEFVNFAGGNKRDAYDKYCGSLLDSLKQAVWSVHCHEQFIFYGLATHTGEVIASNVSDILVIIKEALSEKSDPEVKLKIYMALNEVIKDHENTLPDREIKSVFSKAMLEDILPMHLKWYPGRSAEAIRTICCSCLYMILSSFGIEVSLPDTIIPLLQSLLEDPAEKTRILALLSVIAISDKDDLHLAETFSNMVTNVLKRLDDCERKVRELSVQCIQKLYEAHLNQKLNNYIHKGLLEFLYSTLLIHLDDSEKEFREKVFLCLDSVAGIEPVKLRSKLFEQNFRDKEILSRLKTSVEEKLKTWAEEEKEDIQLESINESEKSKVEETTKFESETVIDSNLKKEDIETKISKEELKTNEDFNERKKEKEFDFERDKESFVEDFQRMLKDEFKKGIFGDFTKDSDNNETDKSKTLKSESDANTVNTENQLEIGQGDA